MQKYASIETIWNRDTTTNKLLWGDLRESVNAMIAMDQWVPTLKIDGANIRVIYSSDGKIIRGRTDKAQMTTKVLAALHESTPSLEAMIEKFDIDEHRIITLYGELYGAGVQKGGQNYREDKSFILFDVHMANTQHNTAYFLSWDNIVGIANSLDIDMVPELEPLSSFPQTYDDLFAITGYDTIAKQNTGNEIVPEGIVVRPRFELSDQYGNRVMWKLCYREF
jgi:hypothetical protein